MVIQSTKELETLELIKRRLELLVGAKLRETKKMKEAIKIQDAIRSKVGKWEGSKEIKKWRMTRQVILKTLFLIAL